MLPLWDMGLMQAGYTPCPLLEIFLCVSYYIVFSGFEVKLTATQLKGKLRETVMPLEVLFLISSFKISFSKGHCRGRARNNCRRGPINHMILVLI